MPIPNLAQRARMFNPHDLAVLSRVFAQMVSDLGSESGQLNGARVAIALISLFRSGVTDEAALATMVARYK